MAENKRHAVLSDVWPEIDGAETWYSHRSPDASSRFLADLEQAFQDITNFPNRWPAYVHGTRRFLLRDFPFSVVYREQEGSVTIVAVAHHKRRPGYWKKRL